MIWRPFQHWAQACAVTSAVYASLVVVVDKPQAYWTENTWFIALVSHSNYAETSFSPISTDSLCLRMHKCLQLKIWRFSCQQQQQMDKPIALSARGYRNNQYTEHASDFKTCHWTMYMYMRQLCKNTFVDKLFCCFVVSDNSTKSTIYI